MKPEPLKGKEQYFMEHMIKRYDGRKELFYWRNDVKSAVEWLKSKVTVRDYNEYMRREVHKLIDEAFEDVCKEKDGGGE